MIPLKIDKLGFSFYQNTTKLTVLENINFSINEKESIAFLGPSGCGKSTLLRCISGFLIPQSGNISLNNYSPSQYIEKKESGFAFQAPALLEWKNVKENIELPENIGISTMSEQEKKERLSFLLELTELKGFENYYPNQLSGGMKQRVSLARSLFTNPKLLLLDEPFAALDLLTRTTLAIKLRKMIDKINIPTILVTHSIEEAVIFADRIIILSALPTQIKKEINVSVRVDYIKSLENKEFQNTVSICRMLLLKGWKN